MHGLHFSRNLLFIFIISLAYVWSLGLLAGCIAGVGLDWIGDGDSTGTGL